MATKLKHLKVTSVDFVDEGANPDAHIRLYKRRDEAAADTNGIIVAASAVLDVTSLAIVAMKVTPAVIPHSGRPDNDNAHAPTTSAAPVL